MAVLLCLLQVSYTMNELKAPVRRSRSDILTPLLLLLRRHSSSNNSRSVNGEARELQELQRDRVSDESTIF